MAFTSAFSASSCLPACCETRASPTFALAASTTRAFGMFSVPGTLGDRDQLRPKISAPDTASAFHAGSLAQRFCETTTSGGAKARLRNWLQPGAQFGERRRDFRPQPRREPKFPKQSAAHNSGKCGIDGQLNPVGQRTGRPNTEHRQRN